MCSGVEVMTAIWKQRQRSLETCRSLHCCCLFFLNLVFCKSVPSALHAEIFGKVVLRGRMHKQGGSYILVFHY